MRKGLSVISYPIVKDGKLSNERVDSRDIKRIVESRVVEQTFQAVWLDEDVELKDGRVVTIRNLEIEE